MSTNNYKLTDEAEKYIIHTKQANPKISCRGLIPLIQERFQVNLSKSLINNVIKAHNLSGPVGRRVKEVSVLKDIQETKIKVAESGFMENGGYFFLKAADIRLSLTSNLAKNLLVYFPSLSRPSLQLLIETSLYSSLFKDKKSLSLLIGRKISQESLSQYSWQITQIPFYRLKEILVRSEISHNIFEINELYEKCLLQLNSFILNFFPPEYQFLDFRAMQDRFYFLPAKIERKPGQLLVQLFYDKGFFWLNDIIWQEGFSYATHKLNEARIFTRDGEQILFNSLPALLDESAFSHP